MALSLSLGSLAEGMASGMQMGQARKDRQKANEQQDRMLTLMEKQAISAPSASVGAGMGSGIPAAGGGAPIASAAMPTGEMADYFRNGLIKRGMAEHEADGFLMNFGSESGLNTGAVGDNGAAFGVAQWNGPRQDALRAFAAERKIDPSNADLQMDYLMSELNGPEAAAWKKIRATKTPSAAAVAVLNSFERPAEEHRKRREAQYLAYNAGGAMGASAPAY